MAGPRRPTGMKKSERFGYIAERSDELAMSGQYSGWHHIELTLRAEGFHEARSQLDNQFKRKWLDNLCAQAQAKKAQSA